MDEKIMICATVTKYGPGGLFIGVETPDSHSGHKLLATVNNLIKERGCFRAAELNDICYAKDSTGKTSRAIQNLSGMYGWLSTAGTAIEGLPGGHHLVKFPKVDFLWKYSSKVEETEDDLR